MNEFIAEYFHCKICDLFCLCKLLPPKNKKNFDWCTKKRDGMIWSLLFCVHPVHTEAVSGIVGNVFGPPILYSVDIFLLLY